MVLGLCKGEWRLGVNLGKSIPFPILINGPWKAMQVAPGFLLVTAHTKCLVPQRPKSHSYASDGN